MHHHPKPGPAPEPCYGHCIRYKLGRHGRLERPAHHLPFKQVQHDSQIQPAIIGPRYVLSEVHIGLGAAGAKSRLSRFGATGKPCRELGGAPASRPECGNGWFIEPTIFADVQNHMRIAQEEVFGPVLSVLRFKDEEEALAIANDSRYGLGAGVWTADIGRAFRMSARIQSGTVWVNTYRAVSYMSPFGGYKDSGSGRENGIDAIHEYLQVKSVWINTGAATGNPFTMR